MNLSSGQSIVVTVRLFLNHNPSFSEGANSHEDILVIKSSYFEHQICVAYSVNSKDTDISNRQSIFLKNTAEEVSTRQSISPSLRKRAAHQARSVSPTLQLQHQTVDAPSAATIKTIDLERQLSAKNKIVQHLEGIIKQFESKYPSVQELVRNHVEQERLGFEEKSEKVSSNLVTDVKSTFTCVPLVIAI